MKNEKICWRYHHFTHVHQKSQSYDVRFLRYWVRQTFCHFGPFFALLPLPPLMIPSVKILKKMKKMPGDTILLYTHVYHKWRSYIYGCWNIRCNRQKFSTFWAIFLQPLDKPENQSLNIEKNTWRYYHFTHLQHKWQSYDV